MKLDRPRIQVDFNEIVEHDLILLSHQQDVKADSDGKFVEFKQGQTVYVYEYNDYSDENIEYLLADGVAELNDPERNGNWTRAAKWCCRIDSSGIRNVTITGANEQE